jgi:hypothetical protein
MLPDRKDEKVKAKQMEALKRLGHHQLELDEYEKRVANEVIHPDDIHVTFKGKAEPDTPSPGNAMLTFL